MSKRKEEKREQEYYRKKIGEKLEEAYLSIPMGDPPSEETIKKWIQIADQKRAKRLKRKRILLSSAAAVVLCAGVCATCILHTPEAVAGNSGEVGIGTQLQGIKNYSSENDLPGWIKDEFVMVNNIPEDFYCVKYEVNSRSDVKALSIYCENKQNEQIIINEVKVGQDGNSTLALTNGATTEKWGDIEVYINSYSDGNATIIVYSFEANGIIITIKTPKTLDKEEVKSIVTNTVWN